MFIVKPENMLTSWSANELLITAGEDFILASAQCLSNCGLYDKTTLKMRDFPLIYVIYDIFFILCTKRKKIFVYISIVLDVCLNLSVHPAF